MAHSTGRASVKTAGSIAEWVAEDRGHWRQGRMIAADDNTFSYPRLPRTWPMLRSMIKLPMLLLALWGAPIALPALAGVRCLRTYEMNRSDFREAGSGWIFLGVLFVTKDRRKFGPIERRRPGAWTSCKCFEGEPSCSCCDVD